MGWMGVRMLILFVGYIQLCLSWKQFMKARSADLVTYNLKLKENIQTESSVICMQLCYADCVAVAISDDGNCSILKPGNIREGPQTLEEGTLLYLVDWNSTYRDDIHICSARITNGFAPMVEEKGMGHKNTHFVCLSVCM